MSGNDAQAMSEDRCSDCGATAVGGRAGCQALFDELSTRAYSDALYATTYPLALDAYCMQHPERYCHSAKSYAAHLTRLCCGLEHGGDHKVHEAIQKWLNGAVAIEKPEVPGSRGQMTLADVLAARKVEEHTKLVQEWAESVWEAYAAQHALARSWIETALGSKDKRKDRR